MNPLYCICIFFMVMNSCYSQINIPKSESNLSFTSSSSLNKTNINVKALTSISIASTAQNQKAGMQASMSLEDRYLWKFNKSLIKSRTNSVTTVRMQQQETNLKVSLMYSITANQLKVDSWDEYNKEIGKLSLARLGNPAYKLALNKLKKERKERELGIKEYEDDAYKFFYEASRFRTVYSPLVDDWHFFKIGLKKSGKERYKPNIFRVKSKLIELYYNGQLADFKNRVLKGSFLTVNVNPGESPGASLYTDIVTDYFLIGKISLSTQITQITEDSSKTTTQQNQEATIQNLIGGGGNLSLNYNVPIFLINAGGDGPGDASFIAGASLNLFRLGFGIPALGQVDNSPSLQIETGLEAFASTQFLNKWLGVYCNYRMSVIGGDQKYMNIHKDQGFNGNTLFVNQFTAGISIKDTFRIGVSWFFGNDYVLENFPRNVLSVTIVP